MMEVTVSRSTNEQVTAVTVSSANGTVTKETPSNVATTSSPLLAVNVPTISSMPVTMQVQSIGNMENMPLAVCAFNSQQPIVMSSHTGNTLTGTPMQSVQANGIGNNGIILLNVGGGAGNNIAAALSQIVAGANIVQQPQVVQTSVSGTSSTAQAVHSTAENVNQISTQNVKVTSNAAATPQVEMIASQVPSMQSNIQVNGVSNITQMSYQQPLTMQTNMTMNSQPQIVMQGQQANQQTQPAAFMLVPIPHMPASAPLNQSQGCITVNQPQQPNQQLLMNVPAQNQINGNYQVQPSIQNLPIASPTIAAMGSHQQPQILAMPTQKVGNQFQQTTTCLPKNSELKAFLTQPRNVNNNIVFQQTVANAAPIPPIATYATNSTLPYQIMNASSTPGQNQITVPLSGQMVNASPLSNTVPRYQTTVSSPGLAFLAQVSSLSVPNQNKVSQISTPTSIQTTSTICSSVTTTFQSDQSKGHNASISGDILKSHEFLGELSFSSTSCSTPIMTVSSTTKLGDESIPEIPESTENIAEANPNDIPETSSFSFSVNPSISTTTKSGVREKRKKGPAPKLNGTEVCLICGDKASGFHYNVLSCEGCKGFFRRSVIKGAKYVCKVSGNCHIDLYMRRKCQECRFKKCKSVGMKEESVLSEEQVKAKKLKKESEHNTSFSPLRALSEDSHIPALTPHQRKLVELLNANERRFQWPTTEDMKKVTAWVEEDDSIHSRSLRFAHFTELCILIVQLVVEFTKQLPGFLQVLREDQIVLLKACAIEVMLLRAAKQYNKHDGTINFLNGKLYDKSSFYRAGMQVEFVDPIFQFCNSMAQLDLDETEYAILVAINTFSTDRPQIKDIEKVESMQDPYVELLRVYSKIRHPNDPVMFARILMKIVELRTLNNYHSEQMFALKVQDRKLPPLLAEIWDM